MKSAPFAYVRPHNVEEAVRLLDANQEEGKLLAGGQSLIPLMALRFAYPTTLIDISLLDELLRSSDSGDVVRYGAGTTHSAFEDGLVPDPTGGLLKAAASGIGYRAVRNRGTLGGSLAHADASAEWPTIMAALEAVVVARSVRGEREIPAEEFVRGFFWNALDEDELVVRVEIPRNGRRRWGWQKSVRKVGEFAESLAVVLLDPAESRNRVWLGAARDVPIRLAHVEDILSNVVDNGTVREGAAKTAVLQAVAEDLGPASTPVERYRTHLHGITVWRALVQAAGMENQWNN